MDTARAIRRLALDLALWYSIPVSFLALYVLSFGEPFTAVVPHILLVTLPLLALLLLRLLLQRLIGDSPLRRPLVAMFITISLGLLLTYYPLVLIGLRSWGGVVAWNVIPTFFAQSTVLTDALAVPPLLFPITAALLLAGLAALCWLYLGRFDWIGAATGRISTLTLATLTLAATAVLIIEVYEFSLGRWTPSAEPFSLTLYPPRAALDLEGYSVNPLAASHFDRAADQARATYSPADVEKKNLVLIVVDALRPDHMGLYGYARDTTPNLARIVREHPARIIPGVHATCGDTICALFSLFSSKFTKEFSFRPFTLHEALRRNGYRIHMLLSGDHTYFHSLKSIYGQVDSFYDGTQAEGYFINDDQLLVDRTAAMPSWDGTPGMFQFHLMSSHILRKPDAVPGKFQPARRYALRNSVESGPGGEPPQTAVNFYDNGVLRSDCIISGLLELLQAKGYLRNTLVIITADHGESLGEHGLFTHANSVREEVLHVPLVLISFGYRPASGGPERAFSSQVDIAPTVLSELGLAIPSVWTGQTLDAPTGLPFTVFEEHQFAGLIDLRDPAHVWKYWVDRRSGVDHVFNLAADPHEDSDVSALIAPAVLEDLRARTHAQTSAGLEIR
jgi:glucan phosphoethanolaminetransferase (alkaline phosphatase superfamily)